MDYPDRHLYNVTPKYLTYMLVFYLYIYHQNLLLFPIFIWLRLFSEHALKIRADQMLIFRAYSENKGRSEAYFQSSYVISATFIFVFLRK